MKRRMAPAGPSPIVRNRSNDARTASASTGVPSWKVTPERMVKVQTLLSSFASHDSAMTGTYLSVALPSSAIRPS